jgi:hypothetical protein
LKNSLSQAPVAHASNPSYSGSKYFTGKYFERPYLEKPFTKIGLVGVAQGEGPEFKPQC